MRARAVLLTALMALSACGGEVGNKLPDVRLPTLGGALGPSLAACATEKCLTVVVAPWCSVCHAAAPQIVLLRRFLDSAGISSRVVVGLSELEPAKEFAAEFGSDSLLDPGGKVPARGVPLFLVTNRNGEVIRRVNGFPRGATSAKQLAEYFGLP